VHSSRIEPLPHQITAVYGEMLPRQPLRFLLADDPGAGKTIMATRGPPASVVLTLWPSMIAAEGLASRPTRSRSAITSAWFIRSNRPSSRQAANQR
jgi:hypothetical protein